jgi:hypothetical protein
VLLRSGSYGIGQASARPKKFSGIVRINTRGTSGAGWRDRSPLRCGRPCGILAQHLQVAALEDEISQAKDAGPAVIGTRAVPVAVGQARGLRRAAEKETGLAHVADAPAAMAGGKLHEGLALGERDIEIADATSLIGTLGQLTPHLRFGFKSSLRYIGHFKLLCCQRGAGRLLRFVLDCDEGHGRDGKTVHCLQTARF